jgi:hypothetical protein
MNALMIHGCKVSKKCDAERHLPDCHPPWWTRWMAPPRNAAAHIHVPIPFPATAGQPARERRCWNALELGSLKPIHQGSARKDHEVFNSIFFSRYTPINSSRCPRPSNHVMQLNLDQGYCKLDRAPNPFTLEIVNVPSLSRSCHL